MKLIDKDALVAEIEKLYNGEIDTYTRNILDRLKSNIDTLEVKEVDSEKENLTPNDLSIIWNIIINLVTELQLRINKWPGEKIFEEALKRFIAQQGER